MSDSCQIGGLFEPVLYLFCLFDFKFSVFSDFILSFLSKFEIKYQEPLKNVKMAANWEQDPYCSTYILIFMTDAPVKSINSIIFH